MEAAMLNRLPFIWRQGAPSGNEVPWNEFCRRLAVPDFMNVSSLLAHLVHPASLLNVPLVFMVVGSVLNKSRREKYDNINLLLFPHNICDFERAERILSDFIAFDIPAFTEQAVQPKEESIKRTPPYDILLRRSLVIEFPAILSCAPIHCSIFFARAEMTLKKRLANERNWAGVQKKFSYCVVRP